MLESRRLAGCLACTLAAVTMLACGDGDGGEHEPPTCSIGVAFHGAVDATFRVQDDVACGISHSFDSGIDVVFLPGRAVTGIELRIAEVTEGEVGSGFPMQVTVTAEDERRFSTSAEGCNASISEHRLEKSESSNLGEIRRYQVAGTGLCEEPALTSDAVGGEIALEGLAFRIPAVWRD